MSNFCFFTDADLSGRLNPQDALGAFGVVSDTEFRVTSLHTASASPRVFAICDGRVAVQQTNQPNIVSLILKPTDQPPGGGKRLNFVPIKCFIYKGVLKDSLISGEIVADESKNQLTYRAKATQDAMNRESEARDKLPPNSITLSPSRKFLAYDIGGTDDESLDKLFYKPDNSSFEPLSVSCGDYIGDFDQTLFGLEIVLDDVRAKATFKLTKQVKTRLQASPATANNPSQLFKRRDQKEAATSFMDPCAFYGSFFQHGIRSVKLRYRLSANAIDVEKATKDSDLKKANGTEIYDKILFHFSNKNAVYVDIRNELNTSLNFYQHYDNLVQLKIPPNDNSEDKDYYGNNGWPLLVLGQDDFISLNQNNDSDEKVIGLGIALPNPSRENASPLVYISQGYLTKIKRRAVLRGEKRYLRLATGTDYTDSFSVAVANISSEAKITPVSQYIRIKYLKSVPQGASSGIVPRASNYLDLLFLPFRMKIPFAVTANSKSRVYQEDVFMSLLAESGCESVGAVGIAEDTQNFTLFAYAGQKLRTTGVIDLQTISLPSEVATESHYLNLVRDRYRREKLYQGVLNLGLEPKPIYLRFADSDPGAAKDSQYPNLSDEFLAVVIRKANFWEMRLDYGNAGFSLNYDTFLRLTNEDLDLTSDAIVYTTYDLVLEGYKDDGTNISLSTFDTGIRVYSFGHEHNLILVDGAATYDAATPFDELPSCTGAFNDDDLGHLRSFIKQTSTASGSFRDLWTKVFNIPGGAEIKVTPPTGPPPYKLENPYPLPVPDLPTPPPPTLPRGRLAEACTVFALYKFQQQLLKDTSQDTDVDAAGKSTIYKALKEVLIKAGFRKPATGPDTLEFNQMMVPDKHIGLRGDEFLNPANVDDALSLKKVMYDLMITANEPEVSKRKFNFFKSSMDDIDIFRTIDSILRDYGRKIAWLVNEDSICAYRIFLPTAKPPTNLFLASGDGSVTTGLFDEEGDKAVVLFNYSYDGTGGVNNTAKRNFSSLDSQSSTVVHLTMFGLDNDAPVYSSVEAIKDGITYVFRAARNSPISPVDGELPGQACYDSDSRLFYHDTISGRYPLAKYIPEKKDLLFLEIGKTFAFDVQLRSAHGNTDEEVSVSINVVEGPQIHIFEFEAEDLFENDVYDVTGTKKTEFKNALLKNPQNIAAIDFMIKRLIEAPDISIFIELRGNFVGKYLQPNERPTNSLVGPDERYQFSSARANRQLENVLDPPAYSLLRYSFGRVVVTDDDIIITIESYVSPLWSRLDNKIFNIFQSPVATAVEVAKKKELDELTHYYKVTGSDAYVDHVGGDTRASDTNRPELPSYNPILSGLRSFGLAVALKEFLADRASDAGHDAFDVNTAMEIRLLQKIKDAKVSKNESLGLPVDLEFKHFEDFK